MLNPAARQPAATSRQMPRAVPGYAGPAAAEPAHAFVRLRYLERSPILVRGPASGQQYRFSADQPIQSVDARDAESLLGTRYFRRAP